jgi:hypothetical protein
MSAVSIETTIALYLKGKSVGEQVDKVTATLLAQRAEGYTGFQEIVAQDLRTGGDLTDEKLRLLEERPWPEGVR